MSHIQLTEMSQSDSARKEPIFLFYGFSIRLKPQNIERASQIPEQKNFDLYRVTSSDLPITQL